MRENYETRSTLIQIKEKGKLGLWRINDWWWGVYELIKVIGGISGSFKKTLGHWHLWVVGANAGSLHG